MAEDGSVFIALTKNSSIAYTISGEWEYEGLKLPVGTIAYEPVGSVHTPSSDPGAELVEPLGCRAAEVSRVKGRGPSRV